MEFSGCRRSSFPTSPHHFVFLCKLVHPSLPSRVHVDVLTTFPELFATQPPALLGVSMPRRAIDAGALTVSATDIRTFTHDKHQKTDDRPFGGGPGMVMMCQPVWDAFDHVEKPRAGARRQRVYFTPQGTPLSQELVAHLASCEHLVMLAGHYEGIDERVIEELAPLEVSLGDFVVSGGEVAALVTIDAIARLLPGVLGHEDSSVQDSFSVFAPPQGFSTARDGLSSSKQSKRLLDCPHYTKPREWRGRAVPDVLLSGDHEAIAKWRHAERLRRTFVRRPDLL